MNGRRSRGGKQPKPGSKRRNGHHGGQAKAKARAGGSEAADGGSRPTPKVPPAAANGKPKMPQPVVPTSYRPPGTKPPTPKKKEVEEEDEGQESELYAALAEVQEAARAKTKDVLVLTSRPTKEGRMNPLPSGLDGLRYDAYDHWVKDAIRARLPKEKRDGRDEFSCLRVLYSTLLCAQRPYPHKWGRRGNALAKHPEKYQWNYKDVVWLVCRTGFLSKETGQSPTMIKRRLRWLIRVRLVEEAPGHVGTPVSDHPVRYANMRLIRVRYELAFYDPVVKAWKWSGGEVDENLVEEDDD
jgi:hypothetical protein